MHHDCMCMLNVNPLTLIGLLFPGWPVSIHRKKCSVQAVGLDSHLVVVNRGWSKTGFQPAVFFWANETAMAGFLALVFFLFVVGGWFPGEFSVVSFIFLFVSLFVFYTFFCYSIIVIPFLHKDLICNSFTHESNTHTCIYIYIDV